MPAVDHRFKVRCKSIADCTEIQMNKQEKRTQIARKNMYNIVNSYSGHPQYLVK